MLNSVFVGVVSTVLVFDYHFWRVLDTLLFCVRFGRDNSQNLTCVLPTTYFSGDRFAFFDGFPFFVADFSHSVEDGVRYLLNILLSDNCVIERHAIRGVSEMMSRGFDQGQFHLRQGVNPTQRLQSIGRQV